MQNLDCPMIKNQVYMICLTIFAMTQLFVQSMIELEVYHLKSWLRECTINIFMSILEIEFCLR